MSPHAEPRRVLPGRAPALPGAVLVAAFALLPACDGGPTTPLASEALRNPEACKACHPAQYEQWAGSMHAYAADDPVFVAMNKRAQRESGGALGTFCVNCHAPMAVREGLTKDGLDLAALPRAKKGVTCYFCHATESIAGTHDNPLVLAKDDSLFGPFADPVAGTPHVGKYSPLFDDTQLESAAACGACHDIVNKQGAHVERTFEEWGASVFSKPGKGLACTACHMDGSDGPASINSTRTRRVHTHDFAAVDLALTPWPRAEEQRQLAQKLVDISVQSTVCWNPTSGQIEVTLDNVGGGHGFPSGATPDRRAWVEVDAFAGDEHFYSSGGPAAAPLEASADPDLWLIRDCLTDTAGGETHLFWQAAGVTSNQLPASVTGNANDPASFEAHRQRTFPSAMGARLAKTPDRITLKVHLQAIGDDVLGELVASGDLDPAIPPQIARFEVGGAALEWTPATATLEMDARTGLFKRCATTGVYRPNVTPAATHARCGP